MSAERRNLVIAAAAAVVAIVLLILVLAGNGDDDGKPNGPQGTRTPSQAEQQLARDREQIAQVAERYQRALDPKSTDNPCRYMTAAARAKAGYEASQAALEDSNPADNRTGTCADVIRKRESADKDVPLYQALPGGITAIEFRRSVPSAHAGGSEPGAIATWKAAGYGQVSFVRDDSGQWRIAE